MSESRRHLPACPKSPNCVSTQATTESQLMPVLHFNGSANDALEQIAEVVGSMSGSELVAREANYLHFVFTTRWLRFQDDVEFLVDETRRQVDFRSASRLGYSDLGANRKRMQSVCQQLCRDAGFTYDRSAGP